VTEEADNGGFLSHSTGLSLDNSLPSFQEYAPSSCVVLLCGVVFLTLSTVRTAHIKEETKLRNQTRQPIDLYTETPRGLPGDSLESDISWANCPIKGAEAILH